MCPEIKIHKRCHNCSVKPALMDLESKTTELEDMRRKGMVTHQQYGAIKSRLNQWFVDYARQVL